MNKNNIFGKIQLAELSITNHQGDRLDIKNSFDKFNIFEDIFSPFLTAQMIFTDTNDIIKNFPIIGNEKIIIRFKNVDEDSYTDLTFKLYKILPDKDAQKEDFCKSKSYVFNMISEEAIVNNMTSISRRFNANGSEIVKSVCMDYLETIKSVDVEDTFDELDVFSNFWHPIRLIKFISKMSRSNANNDYLFFENTDGFNFKSLSSLLDEGNSSDTYLIFSKKTLAEYANFNNIQAHKMVSYFDLLSAAQSGVFGNTYFKLHDTEYSYEKTEMNIQNATAYGTSLGNYLQYDESVISAQNEVDVKFYNVDLTSKRNLLLKKTQFYNWSIKLWGHNSRKAGQLVKANFPNIDNETLNNELMDGLWLISSINHSITSDSVYKQNLNLIKNAFQIYDKTPQSLGRTKLK